MTSAQLTWNSGKSAERAKETLEHFSSAKNLYSGEFCRINFLKLKYKWECFRIKMQNSTMKNHDSHHIYGLLEISSILVPN